jgi:hypothetical protein
MRRGEVRAPDDPVALTAVPAVEADLERMRSLLRDEQRELHRRVAALAREVVREGHQRAAHA